MFRAAVAGAPVTDWIEWSAARFGGAISAFLRAPGVVIGQRCVPNPIRRLISASVGSTLFLEVRDDLLLEARYRFVPS